MGKQLPRSRRAVYKVKIGGRSVICKVKESTGTLFSLTPATAADLTSKGVKRGVKGTKSYTIHLKNSAQLGNNKVKVWSVAFPVDAKVKMKDFYAFAKSNPLATGITTPWGVTYNWAKSNRPSSGSGGGGSGGGGGGGGLGGLGGNLLGNLGSQFGDDLGALGGGLLGGYLGGNTGRTIGANLGGQLGGYLGTR